MVLRHISIGRGGTTDDIAAYLRVDSPPAHIVVITLGRHPQADKQQDGCREDCYVSHKPVLSYSSFERNAQEFLGFNRKLHGQFIEHVLGVAIDDKSNGLFGGYAALVAIEQLVLGDF